jgi:hypothetical protein
MSSVVIAGNTSGTITLDAPNVAGTTTLTLPTTSGTILTSANTFGAGTGPAFSVSKVTSQNISTTTQTKVAFDSEEFDTASCFNTSTNRFTPNVAGYYYLNANVRLNLGTVSGNDEYYISIYKNGTQFKRGFNRGVSSPPTNANILLGISSLVYANGTTDYFEIYALQCSSTTATVGIGDNPQQPFFQGFLVRSA